MVFISTFIIIFSPAPVLTYEEFPELVPMSVGVSETGDDSISIRVGFTFPSEVGVNGPVER